MLTPRGWWLFIFLLALLTVALASMAAVLVLVALTLLCWFVGLWIVFALRWRFVSRRLRLTRILLDENGPVSSLWACSTYTVQVSLHNDSPLTLPYVRLRDRLPPTVELHEGGIGADGPVPAGGALGLTFRIVCAATGRIRFDGLGVQVADVQGFFLTTLFLRNIQFYRVLPPLVDARGKLHASKRHNLLPLLGTHRHRRPGSGSELLDLRDYLPGDPPKTIAWKVSARRDRLMTKEYESEVPIRCTLFLDVSPAVRVGGAGFNALARLVEIAAAVAQASAAARDPTGLCLFDEDKVGLIRPARGARHLVRLLQRLADVALLPPQGPEAALPQLLPLAYGLAEEVYPELLRPEINACPWWLPWLAPQPPWTLPKSIRPISHLVYALTSRLAPRRRRLYRWRKQLAALLTVHYRLGPTGLASLMEDDPRCGVYLQKFLAEHQVPFPLTYYDADGRYLFAAPRKVEVLARALLRAVLRGRDNELFVLLADLLELDDLEPLFRAIKVAKARHHQILILCPWPPGMPRFDKEMPADQVPRDRTAGGWTQEIEVQRALLLRLNQAYQTLRRRCGGLGVPVLCAAQDDAAALVLQRLERLRTFARGRL